MKPHDKVTIQRGKIWSVAQHLVTRRTVNRGRTQTDKPGNCVGICLLDQKPNILAGVVVCGER